MTPCMPSYHPLNGNLLNTISILTVTAKLDQLGDRTIGQHFALIHEQDTIADTFDLLHVR
jgi:hypothetical protein